MADDVPHDGASPKIPPQLSPEMEAEPEPVLLPLRVRPFDPMTYDPPTYALPPESVWHFKRFKRGAPDDLLLQESASHLSYDATEAMEPYPQGSGTWSSPMVSAILLMRSASTCSAWGYHTS
ncbi:hypothetical protein CsSME_00021014 [Camellia sinensis var. sinensis]